MHNHYSLLRDDHFWKFDAGKNHVSNGGDGVTNFNPADLFIYEKAVEEFGDSDLWLSKRPYDGPWRLYSLRCKKRKDLSKFWEMFKKIEAFYKRKL